MTKSGALVTLSIPDHQQVARGTLRALIAKAGAQRRGISERSAVGGVARVRAPAGLSLP
jgi:hypothetical protein